MKIKIINLVFFFFLIYCPTSMLAQSEAEQINAIKRNAHFVFSEYTHKEESEARKLAKEQLKIEIERYVEDSKDLNNANGIAVRDIVDQAEEINMRRGTMYRVFVFVKKKDIVPIPVIENKAEQETQPSHSVVGASSSITTSETSSTDSTLKLKKEWQQSVIDNLQKATSLRAAWELLKTYQLKQAVKRCGMIEDNWNKDSCFIVMSHGNEIIVYGPGKTSRTNFKKLVIEDFHSRDIRNALWFTMYNY